MKIGKRILMSVLSLSMAAAIVAPYSIAATVSPYSNNGDTRHTVNIKSATYTYGPKRVKENSTCIYFWGRSCADSHVRVRAVGYVSASSTSPRSCTQLQSGNIVPYVICRVGVKYLIYNTVYENDYDYAGLGFSRNGSTTSVPLDYTWSPDSVGSYTPAT